MTKTQSVTTLNDNKAINFKGSKIGMSHYNEKFPATKNPTYVIKTYLLSKFLDKGIVTIPEFQREYSWGKQELSIFMDKLIDKIHKKDLAGMVTIIEFEVDEITKRRDQVDGQQRLTTLMLALSATRDLCLEYAEEDGYKEFEVELKKAANFIQKKIYVESDNSGDSVAIISSEELGSGALLSILSKKGISSDEVKELSEGYKDDAWRKVVTDAYLYIKERLMDQEVDTIDFANKILYGIELSVYTTEDQKEGIDIFKEVNTVGKKIGHENIVRGEMYKLEENHRKSVLSDFKSMKTKITSNNKFAGFIENVMKSELPNGEDITEGVINEYIFKHYSGENVVNLVNKMKEKFEFYNSAINGKTDQKFTTRENEILMIMKNLGFTTYLPTFLKIFEIKDLNQKHLLYENVLDVHYLIQSILGKEARQVTNVTDKVLRSLRDSLSSTNKNKVLPDKIFVEMIDTLKKSINSVSDEVIISNVKDFVVKKLSKSKVRGVLMDLETNLRKGTGKEMLVMLKELDADHYFAKNSINNDKVSIEKSSYIKYIDTLPNFKLLGTSINRSVKDAAPTEKNGHYMNSELMLNKEIELSFDDKFENYYDIAKERMIDLILNRLDVVRNSNKNKKAA